MLWLNIVRLHNCQIEVGIFRSHSVEWKNNDETQAFSVQAPEQFLKELK